MNCVCVENNYNNTNFTVGKNYEYKLDGHIRTDWANMWIKDYKAFEIENGVFECGLCKFRVDGE